MPFLMPLLVLISWQVQTTPATNAEDRMAAYAQRQAAEKDQTLAEFPFTSIGPRSMGGRIVDLMGFPKQPHRFMAAYASGGLWQTFNNGTTWEPLFDRVASITIGDFAVDPDRPNRIWVGTGEENSSRSSYAGTGVYLSEDGGKTWHHKGLADTHHVGKILIHPNQPDTVYVAAIGHLYTPNEQRGVFKTTDAGVSWQHVLKIDDLTGVIDLVMDPTQPDRLYAAAWQRSRKAWNFEEGGPGSGIYRSENGGGRWEKLAGGLPQSSDVGRIGLSIAPSQPDTIYACIDYQGVLERNEPEKKGLTKKKLANLDRDQLLSFSNKDIDEYLRDNQYHADITAKTLRSQLTSGEVTIADLINYVYDGNAALFDREVHGAQVFRSDDRGATWTKTHEQPLSQFVFSYGYYFGVIEVDPLDPDTIYLLGVWLLKSKDGGKTFANVMRPNVHVDHQALWIHPRNSNFLLLGNDGGINMSWDAGLHWNLVNNVPVGQFYTVTYDMAEPYKVYGGLQDNGVWYGESKLQGRYGKPWEKIHGGDGAFVQVDFRDNVTVYSGFQFGHYHRTDLQTGDRKKIFPRHKLKEDPYRFNWMTPFVLSRHQQDVAYMGSQRVLRSLDKGESWKPISDDLTTNPEAKGDVTYGTITALRESPHRFGTLYAGTDDGRLWVTRGGVEWQEIGRDITKGLWVSSIEVSPHQEGTVFVTCTGYRNDDFNTYVFRSSDFGRTWASMRGNLPNEACNVIRQDTKNENLLFLGTDVGLWLSLDGGKQWRPHQANLPNIPVYAIEIHPREHELIVATHGRSIYTLDLEIVSQLSESILANPLTLFSVEPVSFEESWGNKPAPWPESGAEEVREKPGQTFWFAGAQAGEAVFTVADEWGVIARQVRQIEAGVNSFRWDFGINREPAKNRKARKAAKRAERKPYHRGENGLVYANEGRYQVRIAVGDQEKETFFTIE